MAQRAACAVAHLTLCAGWPVVVDAAFLCRSERAQFAALAASLAVPFSIFDCLAALPLLRQRLEQRQASGADPSEADVAVLERLSGADERLDERERAVAIIFSALGRSAVRREPWSNGGQQAGCPRATEVRKRLCLQLEVMMLRFRNGPCEGVRWGAFRS